MDNKYLTKSNRSILSISKLAAIVVVVIIIIVAAGVGAYVLLSTTSTSTTSSSATTSSSTTTSSTAPSSTTTSSTTSTTSTNTSLLGPYTEYNGSISSSPLCASAPPSGGSYVIGALTDLTSTLSSEGIRVASAINLAVSDINNALSAQGCKAVFSASIDNYNLDPTIATSDINAFNTAGVKVVIGPLNSGTAIVILPIVDADHMVLISPSSTSIALHIPNDYLFRTAPSDTWQAQADAREMWSLGIRNIVVAHVHDTYGDNLANTTAADFMALGGKVQNQNNFVQWAETQTDFSTLAPLINQSYTAAVTAQGGNKTQVGIYMVSFEECVNLFEYVHTNYPSLLNNLWFGSDGTATSGVIVNATTSGPYVAQVKLPSTEYAAANSSLLAAFSTKFATLGAGYIADGYSTGAYDDAWLAALSILAGGYNGTGIQQVISSVAAKITGVSGNLALDSAGDRVPSSGYDIWQVVGTSPNFTWKIVGHWSLPDNITWTSMP